MVSLWFNVPLNIAFRNSVPDQELRDPCNKKKKPKQTNKQIIKQNRKKKESIRKGKNEDKRNSRFRLSFQKTITFTLLLGDYTFPVSNTERIELPCTGIQ